MKNWQITGFLAILILGFLLISGCTSTESTSAAVSTPTPQIVYVTVTPTLILTYSQGDVTVGKTFDTSTPTYSPSLSSGSINFSGSSNDVRSFSVTERGLKLFSMSHSGQQKFTIKLLDNVGGNIALLVNEIGPYSGKKTVTLSPGKYILDITAYGPWTINISSI